MNASQPIYSISYLGPLVARFCNAERGHNFDRATKTNSAYNSMVSTMVHGAKVKITSADLFRRMLPFMKSLTTAEA